MQEIATHSGPAAVSLPPATTRLVQILWRRRWTLAVSMLACLCTCVLYLLLATPVYRAAAKVVVEQNNRNVFGENPGYVLASENYSQTQRDVFMSSSVLSRALQAVDYRKLKTFAEISGDPVAALEAGNGFDVAVAANSDVLVVSMESRYPDEAVEFVDSVVKAYVADRADRDRAASDERVKVLHQERESLETELRAARQAMAKAKQADGGRAQPANESGNAAGDGREGETSLSAALANSRLVTLELKEQQQSIRKALSSRPATATFVQGLQFKSRDIADHEYDDLRTQLLQQKLALATLISVQGINHPEVRVEQSRMDTLVKAIADKERAITEAQLASVSDQLEAAEAREQQLKSALAGQGKQASDTGPEVDRYSSLEAGTARMRKQIDLLDQREAEISANAIGAQPANVEVLDWATADKSPVRPRRGLALLAAFAAGALLGTGAALFRDRQDCRIRTPEEALAVLGVPLLAVVPRITSGAAPVTRGQVVHLDPASAAAEAYRSIRTSLSVGAAREAKTILVASASREDGKSTTAGNLAITFAHAGHRTLLLDCDLRQPVQHLVFSREGGEAGSGDGLTSALAGEVRISSIIYPTQVPGLCLLPCGPVPSNPSEMLGGKRFEQLLDALAASFDRVVIDSSSLASVADARSLAALSDATLLVVRVNRSTRLLCAVAMDSLLRVGANVAGVVANDVPMSRGQQEYYSVDGAVKHGSAGRLAPPARRKLEVGPARPAGTSAPADRPGVVMNIEKPDWSADAPTGAASNDAATPPSGSKSPASDAPGSNGSNGSTNGASAIGASTHVGTASGGSAENGSAKGGSVKGSGAVNDERPGRNDRNRRKGNRGKG